MPDSIAEREPRPGDEQLVTWTARRTTLEQVLGRAAESEEGSEVRRGVSVTGSRPAGSTAACTSRACAIRHGERLAADLVVDAMGRRSVLPKLLAAAGGDPVHEEAEDSGFLYYTRFFRSADGSLPAPRAQLLTHLGSLLDPHDPGRRRVWSVTVYASSRDQPLKRLREASRWTALVRACPLHAHWLDGEPITGILPMGGVIDRYRRFAGNGARPGAGVASVGDAWACTNPSLGRGMALGLVARGAAAPRRQRARRRPGRLRAAPGTRRPSAS